MTAESSASSQNSSQAAEDRKIVTSYAFKVSDELLGLKLASPSRRFFALLIDLFVVAILASLPMWLMAAVLLAVSVTGFFKLKGERTKIGEKLLLGAVAFFSFLILLATTLEQVRDENEQPAVEEVASDSLIFESSGLLSSYELNINEFKGDRRYFLCGVGLECDEEFMLAVANDLHADDYSYKKASEIYEELVAFLKENDRFASNAPSELGQAVYDGLGAAPAETGFSSIRQWLVAAMNDIGISFGWAALYFTFMTAWTSKQTLGKRLFGIKVQRINGKDMDLWSSFGRYGGYSAGLATGLLGFLQIYWDPNRQAIQDKISETVVLRV